LKIYKAKSKYADPIKEPFRDAGAVFLYLKFISNFISIQRIMINKDKRKKRRKVPEVRAFI